ncbi:MAG TPA: TCR/Tet family MFS transporter [Caulobacteraceae bacterium]|jgi:DHA1 family tetracycline resistance protein-like MFS transporter|nr:TCR/Tet family MFS transporter [Caulobacteraceae bacterium]
MTATVAPAARPPRRAAFGFVFGAALVNSVSFGIMIPILPNLIKQMSGGDTAAASTWNALFATVWGLMQFVIGPVLGMLSDRYGRRPILLFSIFGLFVDFLFMAFAPTLAWLFVGRVINGMTAATFSTCNAYVADITPPERRARNFGLMGSAFGFGFVLGPTIGGLLGEHNLRLPFIAAAGLAAINWIYGLLVMPESLTPDRRTARVNWARANPIGALIFLRNHGELLGMAAVNLLFQLSFTVLPSIFVLYTGYRYGWTPKILGLTFLLTGVSQILVQAFLVQPVVRRIGERGAVLLGSSLGALAFTIYAFAPNGWVYLAATPIWAMSGFIQPGLLGLMTRRVEATHQGQLQGAVQSLQGIASFVAPSIYGLSFAWAVRNDHTLHLPGLPIMIAAGLMLGAFLVAIRVAKPAQALPATG